MTSEALPLARNNTRIVTARVFSVVGLLTLAFCLPWFTGCTAANSAMAASKTPLLQPRTPAQRNPRNGQLDISASLPAGAVGKAYNAPISVSGGKGPYTFSISWGSLPQAVSL